MFALTLRVVEKSGGISFACYEIHDRTIKYIKALSVKIA